MKRNNGKIWGTIFLLLTSFLSVSAQGTFDLSKNIIKKNVPISEFNKISVNGSIQTVIYTQSDANNDIATIEAPDNVMEYIECYVKNETLHVQFKSDKGSFKKWSQSKTIKVCASSATLKSATMNGSGSLYFGNNVTVKDLDISVNGSGCINGHNLSCNELSIVVNGSGNAVFKEVTNNDAKMVVNGSGFIKVNDLLSISGSSTVNGSGHSIIMAATLKKDMKVSVNGSGSAAVKDLTAQEAKVSLSGSGEVTMAGKAQKASIALKSSGTVNCGKFEVGNLNVSTTGSGSVYCYASDELTTHINSSSSVVYGGKPGNVKQMGKKQAKGI